MASKLEWDRGPLCCQSSAEVVSLNDQPTTEVFCAAMLPNNICRDISLLLYPWEDGARGLKRWFPMYITQIKHLEKGDHESASKLLHLISNNAIYNQNNHKICSEPLCERGYDVVFHVYHTNHTLAKQGLRKCTKTPPSTSNNASFNKKPKFCSKPLCKRGYEFVFHVISQSYCGERIM